MPRRSIADLHPAMGALAERPIARAQVAHSADDTLHFALDDGAGRICTPRDEPSLARS